MHDNDTYRAMMLPMDSLAVVPVQDASVVELWVGLKTSLHTRRAYAAEAARFLAFTGKPLSLVTLSDLQIWASQLGQGSLKPASQNRALTAVKSLLSFAHETGYVPF